MSRQDDNPVIHQKQFYSTVLKGIFSLDITALGRFQRSNRTGFQNISEEGLEEARVFGASVNDGLAVLSTEERRKRAKDTILVLPYISGGANQTLHLTDVTPKLVVLTVLRGGNHLFMNIAKDERGNARINVNALKEVLKAYGDRLETDVFIGRRSGFLDEQADELAGLAGAEEGLPTIHVGEVNAMIGEFTDQMASCIE
jgi:CRISPR-associated protein Cst2